MTNEEIIERIMTDHWDEAACRCWVCQAGRENNLRPRREYLYHNTGKDFGRVIVQEAEK